MAKFVYKYASVRKVKEIMEKKVQKELSQIELEIEKNRLLSEKIKEDIVKHTISLKMRLTVEELKFHKNYEKVLKKNLESVFRTIDELVNQKNEKIKELAEKSKEVKIFDTLEEIYHQEYDEEERKKDLLIIDEIAGQKFNREKK